MNPLKHKELLRGFLAAALIIVGTTHFLVPQEYAKIVPPIFPAYTSVYVSGFFEILGGIGLCVPYLSVVAARGLISLFIAVFPANIYLALHSDITLTNIPHSPLFYWLRLPFQPILIAWAYWYTRNPQDQKGATRIAKQWQELDRLVEKK
ncbi:DoxX family protein [Leptolyngbya sp. NIES-2104]|uniref:DoxX family protein n=1 Tax=Leptolyngbya sp. NIES-2104 TaxID=1552121 RepID=UPI00073E6235|nr:hypothetical protein [Leptolyngbya sp. NIES-2104]